MNSNDSEFQSALTRMQNQVSAEIQQVAESNRRVERQSEQIKELGNVTL
jgi:hypothetical protein